MVMMVSPRLLALSDTKEFPHCLRSLDELCCEALPGSVAIILRDRELTARQRMDLGRSIRAFTRATGQLFLVADRFDLARSLDADGIHLPSNGFLPSAVGQLDLGVVSSSGHRFSQLSQLDRDAINWLLLSPVCAPRKGRPPLGIEGLSQAIPALKKESRSLQVFALGGVDGETAGACLSAGADGVAVIGAAMTATKRRPLIESLKITR